MKAPKSLHYDTEQDGSVTYLTGKSWKNMNVEKYKRLETFHPST
jgi:hypothetical protein